MLKINNYRRGGQLVTVSIVAVLLLAVCSVGMAVVTAITGGGSPGEPTKAQAASGSISCASWSSAPDGFQTHITNAANKVGVQPALLGAVFLDEHANAWAGQIDSSGNWGSDSNGDGPYQITNWSGFWKAVVQSGYDGGESGSGKESGDIEHMYDSALATGVSLVNAFKTESVPLNTSDQKYIMYAGMYHNRGAGPATTWAKNGFDLNNPPANTTNPGWEWGATYNGIGYAQRTWNNFEDLNVGCQTNTGGSSNSIVAAAQAIKGASIDEDSYSGYKTSLDFVKQVYSKVGDSITATNINGNDDNGTPLTSATDISFNKFFVSPHQQFTSIGAGTLQPGDVVVYIGHTDNELHASIVESDNGGIPILLGLPEDGSATISEISTYSISDFSFAGRW